MAPTSDDLVAWATAGLLLATAFLAVFTFILARATRELAKSSKRLESIADSNFRQSRAILGIFPAFVRAWEPSNERPNVPNGMKLEIEFKVRNDGLGSATVEYVNMVYGRPDGPRTSQGLQLLERPEERRILGGEVREFVGLTVISKDAFESLAKLRMARIEVHAVGGERAEAPLIFFFTGEAKARLGDSGELSPVGG